VFVYVLGELMSTNTKRRVAEYSFALNARMSHTSWMPYSARDPG
jgi:hypothetical protein